MKTTKQEAEKKTQSGKPSQPPKIKFVIPQELKQIKGGKTLQFAYDRP